MFKEGENGFIIANVWVFFQAKEEVEFQREFEDDDCNIV